MINNIKSFITDNQKDLKYILLLVIFLLIITLPKLIAQYNIGIGNWDTYLYLENGRNFAKMGWGDVPSIAPVMPIILSKMFLIAGHPYQEAIFNIDALFYIVGVTSFYLLLRQRFKEDISLIGSVIFATFTLLYSWVAIGGNDIIGVTGTILSIFLIIVAHRYNHRIYYLALPVAAYAFLSRYTAGVMIFSIAFYLLINKINLEELKHFLIGGILGIISISWFLNEFYLHLGTPFPFLGQFSGTVENTVVLDSGFLPDSWYYIKHMPNYLISHVPNVDTFNAIVNPMGNIPSILSYVYIVLFVLGFIFLAYNVYKSVKCSDDELSRRDKTLLLISLVLLVLFLFTLGSVSYILSLIIFIMVLYLLWNVLKKYDIKDLDYDLLMISLFVSYLVFQSILFTKNDRYFITVLPFIAFFITISIERIFNYLKNVEHGIKLKQVICLVIILGLLANTLIFVGDIPSENDFSNIGDACEWLMDNRNVSNYTLIYSDNWPAVSWYMNIFSQRAVINTSVAEERYNLSRDILSDNATHHAASFFIDTTSYNKEEYPALVKVKNFDSVEIYENKYVELGEEYYKTPDYDNNLVYDLNNYRTSVYYV